MPWDVVRIYPFSSEVMRDLLKGHEVDKEDKADVEQELLEANIEFLREKEPEPSSVEKPKKRKRSGPKGTFGKQIRAAAKEHCLALDRILLLCAGVGLGLFR